MIPEACNARKDHDRVDCTARADPGVAIRLHCDHGAGPDPRRPRDRAAGTLVVSWTIKGRDDRVACDTAAAIGVRIHLVTSAGADAGTYGQACTAFSTSVRVGPESYAGTAVLVDALGRARTSTVALQSFTVIGGDVITTSIDFGIEIFTPN